MLAICTIVTESTRAQAAVLAASARRHEPSARLLAHSGGGQVELVGWDQAVDGDGMASVPSLLAHALEGAETACFLDPDVCLYDSLEPLWKAAPEYGVAVVRRLTAVPDDGKLPGDAELLEAGRIDSGCVAVTRGQVAEELLAWWSRRLEESGTRRPWLDLAVDRFPSIAVVDDPGCNISYWNLHERRLERDGERLLVCGRPLRFAHFQGFRADRPYWLSERGTRVRVVDDPLLSDLCGRYAERLRDAGWAPPRKGLVGVERLGNGQRVDHLVKALWDEAAAEGEEFGDPLGQAAADAFVAWMCGPAEHGAASGVNRYLFAAYRTRPDLQQAFPDLDGPDGSNLIAWAWEHGRREVLGELLPSSGDPTRSNSASLAVNVIGYLGETLGLAEAARLYVQGLSAAGVPVSTTAVTPDLPVEEAQSTIKRYGSHGYRDLRTDQEPVFNLACLNADHLAELVRKRGAEILAGRPTIGQWGWETDVLPPSWTAAYEHVEEVWVYSNFMAENLGRLLPMPVVVVPPPVVAPEVDESGLSIAADDRFTFLFMLDLFSTLRRKNPLGLVEAFRRAFAPGEGPRLILKTINARFRQEAADEIRYAAAGHPDVEFVDGYLEPGQKAALLARADCYVSLHRSEGFGLPLAEAMVLGTPVIATGYSGNTDFTTSFNSYLVDWKPARVGPDSEIYPPHGRWAEPDLDHAAEQMRRVWQHPEEAAARAQRARDDILRDYSPKVVGALARARLERLSDIRAASGTRANGRPGAGAETVARVERALAFDLRQGAPPMARGLAGYFRQLVLRLILPFTYHERQVDRALLDAVRDLRAELDQLSVRSRGAER